MRYIPRLSFWSVLAGALCALLLVVGLDLDRTASPTAHAVDAVVAITPVVADAAAPDTDGAAAAVPLSTLDLGAAGLGLLGSDGDFTTKYGSGGSSSRRSSSSGSGSRGYSSGGSNYRSSGSRYRSSGYYDDDGGYYSRGGGCYGCGGGFGGFIGVIILIVVLVVISKVASGIFS